MCGIAGILRLADRPIPEGAIARMLDAIAHRGPDGRGTFVDERIHLGAVRLAILDPAHGAQPVFGCTRDVVAVYNGEIYNHADARSALTAHSITDRCDTSLVPHLFEDHGEALVERMRGMFAFAVWDARARRLLLARDRLGIKPLYYTRDRSFFVFASEPKALFASGLVPRSIDRDALDDLFSFGYPFPPRSMFKDVLELQPAHILTVDDARVSSPRRYWRAPFGTYRAASPAELRALLQDTVALHLQSDVPLGAAVSGGIDSSFIAALARAPQTFSLAFPDDASFDESVHARAVSSAIGSRHHQIDMRRQCAALLPAMIHHLDLPLLMPGAIGGLRIAERQRALGVKVSLTGDGADEIFGGYDVFRAAKARLALDRPLLRSLAPMVFEMAARMSGQPRDVAATLARAMREADDIKQRHGGVFPPWYPSWQLLDVERAALLSPDGRPVRPTHEPPAGLAALARDLEPFDAAIAFELETRLPSWILVISDRSWMAHGVEARVPFLDDVVVARVCALPPSQKMRGLQEKWLLRRAAEPVLPRAITRRRKQPFMTPIRSWFFGEERPAFVDDALSPAALAHTGLFAPDVVARLRAGTTFRHELVLMLVLGTQLLASGARA